MPCTYDESGSMRISELSGELDRATRLLCAASKLLTTEQIATVPDLGRWMDEHDKMDRRREAEEKRAKEQHENAERAELARLQAKYSKNG